MRTDKPWGYEELLYKGENFAVKILYVEKGKRLSRQYHRHKHEAMYVLEGEGILELGVREVSLMVGSFEDVPRNLVHRLRAGSEVDLKVLEVSTPHLDDVVRIEDDYGRTGK